MKNKTIKMLLSVLLMVLCAFTLTACDTSGYENALMSTVVEIAVFVVYVVIEAYIIKFIIGL